MFSDIDTMGFPGLAPYRSENTFAITTEGFIPLVEKEYDTLAASQMFFAKQISKSVFVYYCTQHLYARIVTLKRDRGESTYKEDSFEKEVLSGDHSLPSPIEAYIRGIGNVVNPAGLRYRLAFPAWPLEVGHYGRINFQNHWQYMALPAPQIVAQRIQKDLATTRDHNIIRDWNLDEPLRPIEVGAGLPTRNCLGWARAEALTDDQVRFIEGSGVIEDDFPVKYRQFYYNSQLFIQASLAVDRIGDRFKISPQKPASTTGSQAQCCWVEIEPVPAPVTRHNFYAELRSSRVASSFQIGEGKSIIASLVLAYRVRKDETGNVRPYCVYDFGDYAKVPPEYHNTRNTVYDHGRAECLNVLEFTSAYSDKSEYRLAWLKRHKKK